MRFLPMAGVVLCLAGAGWYAGKVDAGALPSCSGENRLSAAEVEKSFEEAASLIKAGKGSEAAITLNERAARNDSSKGVALFLLAELAFSQGADSSGLDKYIEAVKADPALADHGAPFTAGRRMIDRLAALKAGPWASMDKKAPEMVKLNYLDRRLGGGCQ